MVRSCPPPAFELVLQASVRKGVRATTIRHCTHVEAMDNPFCVRQHQPRQPKFLLSAVHWSRLARTTQGLDVRNTDGLIDDQMSSSRTRSAIAQLAPPRQALPGLGIDRKNPTCDQGSGPRNLSTADSNEAVGMRLAVCFEICR